MNGGEEVQYPPRRNGPGEVLSLFRGGLGLTRSEVMQATGLSRSTVAQRLDVLVGAGYLIPDVEDSPTGGRPATRYVFNPEAGRILVAAIGATHFSAVLATFGAEAIAETSGSIAIGDGPEAVMGRIDKAFSDLLERASLTSTDIRGIAISVPGPVEFAQGRVVSPPIMTGWDNFSVPAWFSDTFECPVVLENDVNAMAYGEARVSFPDHRHILVIKIGTGIGCGIVVGGALHRGAQGAAGDIGHIQAGVEWIEDQPLPCCCGNTGCVEAYASGWAMIRDLRAAGAEVTANEDVVALARAGDAEAMRLIRRSGRIVGEAIADAVSFFNPSLVLIGGYYTQVDELLLAGIREVVYRQSLPLATRYLQISGSPLGSRAGTLGLCHLLTEHVLSAQAVDRVLNASAHRGQADASAP